MGSSYLQPEIDHIKALILQEQTKFKTGMRNHSLDFEAAKNIILKIRELRKELNGLIERNK